MNSGFIQISYLVQTQVLDTPNLVAPFWEAPFWEAAKILPFIDLYLIYYFLSALKYNIKSQLKKSSLPGFPGNTSSTNHHQYVQFHSFVYKIFYFGVFSYFWNLGKLFASDSGMIETFSQIYRKSLSHINLIYEFWLYSGTKTIHIQDKLY